MRPAIGRLISHGVIMRSRLPWLGRSARASSSTELTSEFHLETGNQAKKPPGFPFGLTSGSASRAPIRFRDCSFRVAPALIVYCGSCSLPARSTLKSSRRPEQPARMLNREVVGRHRERGAAPLCGREPYQRRRPSSTDPGTGQSRRPPARRRYLRDPATASMRAGSPTAGVYSRIRRSSANRSSPRTEGRVTAAMNAAASCAGRSAAARSSSA